MVNHASLAHLVKYLTNKLKFVNVQCFCLGMAKLVLKCSRVLMAKFGTSSRFLVFKMYQNAPIIKFSIFTINVSVVKAIPGYLVIVNQILANLIKFGQEQNASVLLTSITMAQHAFDVLMVKTGMINQNHVSAKMAFIGLAYIVEKTLSVVMVEDGIPFSNSVHALMDFTGLEISAYQPKNATMNNFSIQNLKNAHVYHNCIGMANLVFNASMPKYGMPQV